VRNFPDFKTEALELRATTLQDLPELEAIWSLEQVSQWSKSIPHPLPDNFASNYLGKKLASRDQGDFVCYTLVSLETKKALGYLDLIFSNNKEIPEISFFLHPDHHNKGLMAQAVSNFLALTFDHFSTKQLCAYARVENIASQKLMTRLGFVCESEFLDNESVRGEEMIRRFVLTKENYQTVRLRNGCAGAGGPDLFIPTVLVSAVILVDADDRVLLARRPEGKSMAGLWEFPGGKVEPGETPEAALIRELDEELGISTKNSCLAPFTFASHSYPNFHLLMPLYICRIWEGSPEPREGQKLAWVRVNKLQDYPMPPADEPLIAMLRDFFL
jgi:8-oxo-dGTP diphosphatase